MLTSGGEAGACYHSYMRVQIDRFEDNDWAVLLVYPDGRRSFDVPRELLPAGASAGDVFEVRLDQDRKETERLAGENRRLLDELLGSDDR
jgi:hypothetical protein